MFNPKFQATIDKGELILKNPINFKKYLLNFEGKQIDVIIKPHRKTRTDKQNRALHLYFTQLAEALNDSGWDMRKLLKKEIDIPWTALTVKNDLWREIQKPLIGVKSTTELKSNEIDKVYDVLNKLIGERTGVFIPFPCIEELEREFNN